MKTFFLLTFTLLLSVCTNLNAQVLLEDVIADTACICLKKINTDTLSATKIKVEFNSCLNQAIAKNQAAIMESHKSGEQGKEIDKENPKSDQLQIKVVAVLAKKCNDYERVYGKIKSAHQQR
ncbi:MAG: hypothetical protein ACO3EE_09335 [Flavobacteriales bacterium]